MRDTGACYFPASLLLTPHRLLSRVIRLLTLNIKPVFVFDGATPLLKRQTVMARRARRDQSKTKLRRVAEKVLLNTLQRNAGKTYAAGTFVRGCHFELNDALLPQFKLFSGTRHPALGGLLRQHPGAAPQLALQAR